mgnify:CR=1 FL=1
MTSRLARRRDMDPVTMIVITGGPSAGKSTILKMLPQILWDRAGFRAVTIREAATEFHESGLTRGRGGLTSRAFQRHLFRHGLMVEDSLRLASGDLPGKKLVICDRAAMDVAAYVGPRQFNALRRELGQSIVDLRDRRYTGVIFLRSTAVDAPQFYTQANNPARQESAAEAIAADARTLAAWTGHPHLRIIDNSTDLAGKAERAFQAICRVLGVPTPIEIERKFLVREFDLTRLPRPSQAVEIVQHYLAIRGDGPRERIRCRSQSDSNVYYHTVKRGIRPGVRTEQEWQISATEYNRLLAKTDPQLAPIRKTRICFVWQNQYFELDVFREPAGLVLLEIELGHQDDWINLPTFLDGHLLEVTDNPTYSNVTIARKLASG